MAGSAWQSRQGRRVHRLRVGGQVLVIALERPPGRRELVQQAWLADRVVGVAGLRRVEAVWHLGPGTAIISVVVVDAEGAAADHRDVVALARMHHAVVVRRRAIRGGITVDVRCKALPDDLRRRLVLLDDRDDVVVARDRAAAVGLFTTVAAAGVTCARIRAAATPESRAERRAGGLRIMDRASVLWPQQAVGNGNPDSSNDGSASMAAV